MANNEFMGMEGNPQGPAVGTPFEDVRKKRLESPQPAPRGGYDPQTDLEFFKRMVDPAYYAQDSQYATELPGTIDRLTGGPQSRAAHEVEVAKAKKGPVSALDEALKLSLLENRGKTPGEKKTPAGREKEVLSSLKQQLPQMVWDDPRTQSELIPQVLDIVRRGGQYKLSPSPETAERGYLGRLMFGSDPYETGETKWDVEEIEETAQQGRDAETMTFKTQQDFIDYLMEQQKVGKK